uniref:Secreted protein n=1 Tax=Ditylenchus dipsaci TaxID=166011 RepID=A0A915EMC5_9BILA
MPLTKIVVSAIFVFAYFYELNSNPPDLTIANFVRRREISQKLSCALYIQVQQLFNQALQSSICFKILRKVHYFKLTNPTKSNNPYSYLHR